MRYLLDTNALLVGGLAFETLKPSYQRILTDPATELTLSSASIWEMAIKVRLGKLDLQGVTLDDLAGEFRRRVKIRLLPIKQSQLLRIATLPKIKDHGDPFDLLIIAQALT
ncbi:type II toxin-antitoxin system VapC family toxin [Hymenobacter monticola]|uniref:Type II toxin-antitoxin system VapC family toxin n=1 Tax=Hymenobacter monticola TaxID=1705399 RepID=A0ABY4B9Y3_9BACT|nr:type II toxin-antitoxin system VapC family toxin [Hymenobacter monticola]UOE35989.1 type II toxin-antitoxin system VapC family toxin [Hymenobacter monticola]